MTRVVLTAAAERDLARLPGKHVDPMLTYVFDRLPQAPLRMSKPLLGELAGARSARIGPDLRVVFTIENEVIVVLRIDYRSNVYRRR